MSVANFFERSATAASQVLARFRVDAFIKLLEGASVGVVYNASAGSSPEARASLDLAVRLLARLYPKLGIIPISQSRSVLQDELVGLARSINPHVAILRRLKDCRAVLALGQTMIGGPAQTIYIGSDGWVCKLSTSKPVGSGRSNNPFGAGAAACFGAANLFRYVFGDYLEGGALDNDITLSLFDYSRSGRKPGTPALKSTDLGHSHLVGLGAIGNGAVWALSRLRALTGHLALIDPDKVDLGNLQRYVLTTQRDVDRAEKVRLAARAMRRTKVAVSTHGCTWADYVQRIDWKLDRVAVAVDSARDRMAIQASLPRWIVNAWTQPGDLGCSRHEFLGKRACLMCMYLPAEKRKAFDTIVAESIGLLSMKPVVTTLLYSDAPVGREFLETVAKALTIAVEPLLPFAEKPLRTFYSDAICGGIVLQLRGRSDNQSAAVEAPAQVPMAFQSALAGIMLAGELVLHASGRGSPPPVATKINLLRPLGVYLSSNDQKHPSGTCICQDPDYIEAYRRKFA